MAIIGRTFRYLADLLQLEGPHGIPKEIILNPVQGSYDISENGWAFAEFHQYRRVTDMTVAVDVFELITAEQSQAHMYVLNHYSFYYPAGVNLPGVNLRLVSPLAGDQPSLVMDIRDMPVGSTVCQEGVGGIRTHRIPGLAGRVIVPRGYVLNSTVGIGGAAAVGYTVAFFFRVPWGSCPPIM